MGPLAGPALLLPLLAAWIAASLLAPGLAERLLRRLGMVRENFRGEPIPVGLGLAPMAVGLLFYGLLAAVLAGEPRRAALAFLLTTAAFGGLGVLDDRFGSRADGGFRGHFRALFRERRLTTGAVKAIGGGAAALLAAALVHRSPAEIVAGAAVIALSANAVNLLDLRPGRAGAAALALSLLPLLFALFRPASAPAALLAVLTLPAAAVQVRDSRAKGMLGDTGANLLGAALGLALSLALPPAGTALAALVFLGLNGLAERRSIGRLIEETPWLRRLDRLTGAR